jgi:hypothetical protein
VVAHQTEYSRIVADWLCGVEIHDDSLLLFGTQDSLGFGETEHISWLVEKLVFSLQVLGIIDDEHPADHLAQPE